MCSVKKCSCKFRIIHRKTPVSESPQVLSYELCKIFKNIFFNGTPLVAASKKLIKKILQKHRWKTSAEVSFLLQKTPTEVFSFEFCEIFQNATFIEHLSTLSTGGSAWVPSSSFLTSKSFQTAVKLSLQTEQLLKRNKLQINRI